MKASFLTFSQTGNTLQVAHAIGEGLAAQGVEVSHQRFLRRRGWKPQDADLIGVGCPVFENRPAEVVPQYLADSGIDLTGKKAVVYITSGGSPARSLWHLSRAVARTNAEVLGGIQLRGTSVFPTLSDLFPGRPDASDREQARTFGRAVAAHLVQGAPLAPGWRVDPGAGAGLYDWIGPLMCAGKKKGTPLPTCDTATCDLCASCVKECPAHAVKIRDRKVRFEKSCIRCYRCWHICPTAAIDMQFSPGGGLAERLIYSAPMERRFGNVQPWEDPGENRYREVLSRRLRLNYDPDHPTCALVPASEIRPRGKHQP